MPKFSRFCKMQVVNEASDGHAIFLNLAFHQQHQCTMARLIDRANALRPTLYKICHFRDILPSQSLG